MNECMVSVVYSGDEVEVDALIKGGADVNAVNKGGFQPLHVAAEEGSVWY